MAFPEPHLEESSSEPALELLPALDDIEVELEEEVEPGNTELTALESATADPLKLYVRQLGGRLLTVGEERELARLKDLGDGQAKQRLIESNLRLVMSITRNYTRAKFPCST